MNLEVLTDAALAGVSAVRTSVRQRERRQRRERELFHAAVSLIKFNAARHLQREADRVENKYKGVSDAKGANSEEEAAERVPLSDRVPAQATDDPRGKGKSPVEKPAKRASKSKKADAKTSKRKSINQTSVVNEKVDKPSTSAKDSAAKGAGSQASGRRVNLWLRDRDTPAESQQVAAVEKTGAGKHIANAPVRSKPAKRARNAEVEDTKAPEVGNVKRARTRK